MTSIDIAVVGFSFKLPQGIEDETSAWDVATTPLVLREGERAVLEGGLFAAETRTFPARAEDIAGWVRRQTPVPKVSLSGGQYWLVRPFTNASGRSDWVFNPRGCIQPLKAVSFQAFRECSSQNSGGAHCLPQSLWQLSLPPETLHTMLQLIV